MFENQSEDRKDNRRGRFSEVRWFGWVVLLFSSSSLLAVFQGIAVSGEELTWKVENQHFIADFSPNPGTGNSGQLNTVYLKDADLLLTRGTETSTFHLSPNLALDGPWRGINRWDPPAHYEVRQDANSFQLERSGPMPLAPGLEAYCSYRIEPGLPAIQIREDIVAREDVQVTLLRLNEFSMIPGEENPFSHLIWTDGEDRLQLAAADTAPVLPLATKGMGFYSQSKNTGFISLVEKLEMSGPDGRTAALSHESAHYAGDPHYFYYALIYPQGDFDGEAERSWITVEKGTRYSMTYNLLFFRGSGSGAETILKEVDRYLEK